jgi:acyl-coenzyme A synthetase/AMP-(fatty) acid ligase
MQFYQQMGSSSSPVVAFFAITGISAFGWIALFAIAGIGVICWIVSGHFVKEKFRRRDQASAAVNSIFAEIKQTRTSFKDKYMPLAVSKLLDEALELRQELAFRCYRVERHEHSVAIVSEASTVIEKIRAAVDAPFTVEDIESDRLALIAELASLEEEAAAERAAVETSYAEELAQVVSNLAYERERIALSQARLDALTR